MHAHPAGPNRTVFPATSITRPLAAFLLLLAASLALDGCTTLRDKQIEQRQPSYALPADTPTRLKSLAYAPPADAAEQSGFLLLDSGLDALAARLWLAEQAERTLDVQYYIVHGDKTGALVADALLRAAERGVRVRVLLDDIYVHEHETSLLALDSQPNLEIRVFNAFRHRGSNPLLRLMQFFVESDRLNRRMHNKLFIADNQMGITGGRNIGDEYFQAHDTFGFVDLDVLAAGPVVPEMSTSFDEYWNSEAVVPVRAIPGYKDARELLPGLKQRLAGARESLQATAYWQDLRASPLPGQLASGETPWLEGVAHMVVDPPEKVEGNSSVSDLLLGQMIGLRVDPEEELLVISPYFVPGRIGMDWLAYLRARGVAVKVLTNSLAANDVPLVHAGYSRYREPLLDLGVDLYELKPLPRSSPKKRNLGSSGSSRSSLHAKSFVFDRKRVFIGSFNFDPRSALLNTELGLVIDSPLLAEIVALMAEQGMMPANSHRLSLDGSGEARTLVWTSESARGVEATDGEPNSTRWQRFMLELLKLLPIEENL
jgi:putative cardiolipin synthase